MTGPAVQGPPNIAVVGLGNVLMGDDAFGPYVVAALEAHHVFPEGVDLIDAGTPGHELSAYLDGRDALIVIDAVQADGPPGSLRLFTFDEVCDRPPSLALSPHEPGLREALQKLAFSGRAPGHFLLVGAVPAQVELCTRLSEPLLQAVPAAESVVLGALAGFGIVAGEKVPPSPLAPWWERTDPSP